MTVSVEVAEVKRRLSELLAKVEAGEEVIISRGNTPIARLIALDDRRQRLSAIEAVRAFRVQAQPVKQEEIRTWIEEGRRY